MGGWYEIGLFLGLGTGVGVLAAGLLAVSTRGLLAAALVAIAVTVAIAIPFERVELYVAGIAGALVGAVSASVVVRGALRRGGTRLGVAGYIALAGVLLCLIAAIPLVGYLEVVAIPLLAIRMRAREPERHAGLRTLAK